MEVSPQTSGKPVTPKIGRSCVIGPNKPSMVIVSSSIHIPSSSGSDVRGPPPGATRRVLQLFALGFVRAIEGSSALDCES